MKHRYLFFVVALGLAALIGCGGPQKFVETEADPSAILVDAREQYMVVACEGAKTVIAWDMKSRRRIHQADVGAGPVRLYLDQDNTTLRVLCAGDQSIRVFSAPDLKLLGKMRLPEKPSAMAVRQEKDYIFCSADSNVIRPFVGKNPLPLIESGGDSQDMLLQSEPDLLWVAHEREHLVSVIQMEKSELLAQVRVWPNPTKILAAPTDDQIYILCNGRDHTPAQSAIQLIDPFYKKAGLTWHAGKDALDAVIDSMGRNIYVLEKSRLRIISTKTGTQIVDIPTVKNPSHLTVSPDGLRVYITEQDLHTVVVHELKKKQIMQQ